jgi:hypothetical protein
MMENTMEAEIKAMTAASAALQGLPPEAARRVINWLGQHYQAKLVVAASPEFRSAATEGAPATYAEFHELFDAANPESGVENALVVAYWFQVVQKHAELDSQQLNSALKNLGRPSSNITRDLESLIDRSPRLVIQVRKEGSTKQARKRYKLTIEGIRAVERMLTRSQNNGNGNGNGGHTA